MSIKRILLITTITLIIIIIAIPFVKRTDTYEFKIPSDLGKETGTVTDIDGNVYKTVKIGDQWWMAENLMVSRYSNGDPILHVAGDAEWATLTTGAWSSYNNDTSYHNIYGKLYNWYAVNDPRGMCPEGWHVPSEDDWRMLEKYLGGRVAAQGLMKSTRTYPDSHPRWARPNESATNESGFSGLPGGYRNEDGNFLQPWNNNVTIGIVGSWWASTEYNKSLAYFRDLGWVITDTARNFYSDKRAGQSIRCLMY